MSTARVKLFSVDQAEKALPLVRRIAGDLVNSFQQREKRITERQKLGRRPNPGSEAEEQAFSLEREILNLEDEILRFQNELQEVGVELKDHRVGLLDFFSRYEGRIVYLCWKLDDGDSLNWWHDLHAGFRGRQPITPANRSRFKGLEIGQKFVTLTRRDVS